MAGDGRGKGAGIKLDLKQTLSVSGAQ